MAKIKVMPGVGRVVRLMPGGKPIKAEGVVVERTLLIEKWIATGDLVVVAPAPDAPIPVMRAAEKGAKS